MNKNLVAVVRYKKPQESVRKGGIEADPGLFDNLEQLPGFYMSRYQDKPEYDEGFFQIS